MELIYYIFEYPFAGSLLFKVICIFFTIMTICRRAPGKEGKMFRRRKSLFANCSRFLRVFDGNRKKLTP